MHEPRLIVLMALALSAAACISGGEPRRVRLYPASEEPSPQELATLSGFVRFVDDRDVSELIGPFELLPGCHVIGTPLEWTGRAPDGGPGAVATTGRWTFALPMRAGHHYRIEVITGPLTAPVGTLTIKGFEEDLAGNTTREFERAKSPADIEACMTQAN